MANALVRPERNLEMNIWNKISVIAAILQEDLEEYRSLVPYLKEEVVNEVSRCLVKLKPVIDSLLTERVEEMVESLAKAKPVLTVEATPPVVLPLEVNGLTVVEAKPREKVKSNGEWTPIRFPQYILNEGTPVFEYLINQEGAVYNQTRHKLLKDIERSKGVNRSPRVSIYCIGTKTKQPKSISAISSVLMLYTFDSDEDRRRIDQYQFSCVGYKDANRSNVRMENLYTTDPEEEVQYPNQVEGEEWREISLPASHAEEYTLTKRYLISSLGNMKGVDSGRISLVSQVSRKNNNLPRFSLQVKNRLGILSNLGLPVALLVLYAFGNSEERDMLDRYGVSCVVYRNGDKYQPTLENLEINTHYRSVKERIEGKGKTIRRSIVEEKESLRGELVTLLENEIISLIEENKVEVAKFSLAYQGKLISLEGAELRVGGKGHLQLLNQLIEKVNSVIASSVSKETLVKVDLDYLSVEGVIRSNLFSVQVNREKPFKTQLNL
jgi:hypothetical protein|nr:MAG TPA: hypothetical protein [Caudoviricetes sp.]